MSRDKSARDTDHLEVFCVASEISERDTVVSKWCWSFWRNIKQNLLELGNRNGKRLDQERLVGPQFFSHFLIVFSTLSGRCSWLAEAIDNKVLTQQRLDIICSKRQWCYNLGGSFSLRCDFWHFAHKALRRSLVGLEVLMKQKVHNYRTVKNLEIVPLSFPFFFLPISI